MEIAIGLLLLSALTAAVLILSFRAKKSRKQKAEQKRVTEMEAQKEHQEKAEQLERIFTDAKAEHDEAKALDAGRAYYCFIHGGVMTADDERALAKDLHTMKWNRKYRIVGAEIVGACTEGDTERLKKLIDAGYYDVNCRDSGGLPLLCHAIIGNRLSTVKWLVENGADVNITLQSPVDYSESESLLVWCQDRGHCDSAEIGKYLVASGAVKKY